MPGDAAAERAAYDEVAPYTLTRGDPTFIHQHVVDAFAAQSASATDKPIRTAFALIGLYLHLERGCTGRQVQLAHMRLARRRREWPRFDLPAHRGEVTAVDVLRATPGEARDGAIEAWCASVWAAWAVSHKQVAALLETLGETGFAGLGARS